MGTEPEMGLITNMTYMQWENLETSTFSIFLPTTEDINVSIGKLTKGES